MPSNTGHGKEAKRLTQKLCDFRSIAGAKPLSWESIRSTDINAARTGAPDLQAMKVLLSDLANANVAVDPSTASAADLIQCMKVFQMVLQFALWSQLVMQDEHQRHLSVVKTSAVEESLRTQAAIYQENERVSRRAWKKTVEDVVSERDSVARHCLELEDTLQQADAAVITLQEEVAKWKRRYKETHERSVRLEEEVVALRQRASRYETEVRKLELAKASQPPPPPQMAMWGNPVGPCCGRCGCNATVAPPVTVYLQRGDHHSAGCHRAASAHCCGGHRHSHSHRRTSRSHRHDHHTSSSSFSTEQSVNTTESSLSASTHQRHARRHAKDAKKEGGSSKKPAVIDVERRKRVDQHEGESNTQNSKKISSVEVRPASFISDGNGESTSKSREVQSSSPSPRGLPKDIRCSVETLTGDLRDRLDLVKEQARQETSNVRSVVQEQTSAINEIHLALQNLQTAMLNQRASPSSSPSPSERVKRKPLHTPPHSRPKSAAPPGTPNTMGLLDQMKKNILPPDAAPVGLTPPREVDEVPALRNRASPAGASRPKAEPPAPSERQIKNAASALPPPPSRPESSLAAAGNPIDGMVPHTPKGTEGPLKMLKLVPPLREIAKSLNSDKRDVQEVRQQQQQPTASESSMPSEVTVGPAARSPIRVNTTGKPSSRDTTSTLTQGSSGGGTQLGDSKAPSSVVSSKKIGEGAQGAVSPAVSPCSHSDNSISINTDKSGARKKKKKPMPNFSVTAVLLSPNKESHKSARAAVSQVTAPVVSGRGRALSPPQTAVSLSLSPNEKGKQDAQPEPPLLQLPAESSAVAAKKADASAPLNPAPAVLPPERDLSEMKAPPPAPEPAKSYAALDQLPASVAARKGTSPPPVQSTAASLPPSNPKQLAPPKAPSPKKTKAAPAVKHQSPKLSPPIPASKEDSTPLKKIAPPVISTSPPVLNLEDMPASVAARKASRESSPMNEAPSGPDSYVSSPMDTRKASASFSFDDVAAAAMRGTPLNAANSTLSQFADRKPVLRKESRDKSSDSTYKSLSPPLDPTKAFCRHCKKEIPKASRNVHESNCTMREVKCTKCGQRVPAQNLPDHVCAEKTPPSATETAPAAPEKKSLTDSQKDDEEAVKPPSGRGSLNASMNGSSDIRASSIMLQETQRELQALLEEEAMEAAKKKSV